MDNFQFDQSKLQQDFSVLLADFLLAGYVNHRFELEQIQQLASSFVTHPEFTHAPAQTTQDPDLQEDLILLLKHAKIIQLKIYTQSLLAQVKTDQQLTWLNGQLITLLDFINKSPLE